MMAAGAEALDGHIRFTSAGAPSRRSSKAPPMTAPMSVPADGCTNTASRGAPSGGDPARSNQVCSLRPFTKGHFTWSFSQFNATWIFLSLLVILHPHLSQSTHKVFFDLLLEEGAIIQIRNGRCVESSCIV